MTPRTLSVAAALLTALAAAQPPDPADVASRAIGAFVKQPFSVDLWG
jgi:hypothetical protein